MDSFIVRFPRKQKRKSTANSSATTQYILSSTVSSQRSVSATPASKKIKQTFLDLGQKSFGKSAHCVVCDCYYVKGDLEDEKLHRRVCTQMTKAIDFTGRKYQVEATIDEKSEIISVPLHRIDGFKVEELLKQIQRELGGEPGRFDQAKLTKLYIFLEDGAAFGCIVAEQISEEDIRVLGLTAEQSPASITGYLQDNSLPGEVTSHIGGCTFVGIRHVWVHSSARRRGIATKLCDLARQKFLFGGLVPKSRLAFSQPTDDGKRFAQSYCKGDSILVYA